VSRVSGFEVTSYLTLRRGGAGVRSAGGERWPRWRVCRLGRECMCANDDGRMPSTGN